MEITVLDEKAPLLLALANFTTLPLVRMGHICTFVRGM
jgi:hypothetical protein